MGEEYKDGVTLIADAIRKEQAEQAKQETFNPSTVANVSDITAQFSTASKDALKDKDTTKEQTTNKDEQKGTGEENGTDET